MTVIETLRSKKVAGIAVFDVLGTAIIALLLSLGIHTSFATAFAISMMVAILTHYKQGIPTQLGFYLGLNKRVR